LIIAGWAALCAPFAFGDEVNLTPVADTEINAFYFNNNYGATDLGVGDNALGSPTRSLVQFDLSSIPAGATITNVQLTMVVDKVGPGDNRPGPVTSDFDLYLMLVPWTEGNGTGNAGSAAQPGQTTWNELGADGFAAWGAPGGQIGTDYANNWDASASVGLTTGPIFFGATPQFVADAQSWLDDPSANFGFMLISDGENTPGTIRRLASRESATPPTLTVDFTVPEPATGVFLLVGTFFGATIRMRPSRRG
jgi:hypothetical protein